MSAKDKVSTHTDAQLRADSLVSAKRADAVSKGIVTDKASKLDTILSSGTHVAAAKVVTETLDDTELDLADDTYQAGRGAKRIARKINTRISRRHLGSARNASNNAKSTASANYAEGSSTYISPSTSKKMASSSPATSSSSLTNSTSPNSNMLQESDVLERIASKKPAGDTSTSAAFKNLTEQKAQNAALNIAAKRKAIQASLLGTPAKGGVATATSATSSSAGIALVPVAISLAVVFAFVIFAVAFLGVTGAIGATDEEDDINGANLTENEMIVYSFFHEKGLSDVAIAAILGNMWQESGCDPTKGQDGGPGRGLLQWEEGGARFSQLSNKASAQGKTWRDINIQLEFIWDEAETIFSEASGKTPFVYDNGETAWWPEKYTFMSASERIFGTLDDVELATEIFERIYCRASSPNMQNRVEHAKSLLTNDGSMTFAGNDVVLRAQSQLGKPYVWGAVGPNSFDCSGLVSYALTGQYLRICTTYSIVAQNGFIEISASEAVPGDIISNSEHCGIYIGDGKMIHAPQEGEVITISSYSWMSNYSFYRYIG